MNNFGRIITNDCVNEPVGPDARCSDPAFALANPDICPIAPQLVIKPGFALLCALTSVQLRAVFVENGVETDVTDETVFQSSNPNLVVVGALSGNATGLAQGSVQISGTFEGFTAFADLIVLGSNCCDDQNVAMMVMVDQTRSMSQLFNGSYSTKLHYARAAATQFIEEVNETKDLIGLMRFHDAANTIMSEPTEDKDTVAALVPGIMQTQQVTSFYDALAAAIASLDAVEEAERRVIVLISDGEDTDAQYTEDDNPILLAQNFKDSGGIIICLGVRAHSRGYLLLNTLATGGFFINAYDGTEEDALEYLSGLKGYICAGNCTPVGDEYLSTGSLNYSGFANWSVADGHVDLVGNGFMDLLPGNGLYVDMAGSTTIHKGRLVLKESLSLETGNTYRIAFEVAGNQRVDEAPNRIEVKVFYRGGPNVDDPSTAPTGGVINSGILLPTPETYRYAYSYVSEHGETALSPSAEREVTAQGDIVSLTIPAETDATLARVWRTTGASPESRYYLIAELDAAAPAFADTMRKAEMEAAVLAGEIDSSILPPESNTTGTPTNLLLQQIAVNDFREDFLTHSFSFTATGDFDAFISIQQLDTPSGFDATGLLLGSVRFENVTDGEELFFDDFDDENLTYVPPRCGIGTTYIPTYTTIEGEETDIIPTMTSNTEPSGQAFGPEGELTPAYLAFDNDAATYWSAVVGQPPDLATGVVPSPSSLVYQFDEARTVVRYRITPWIAYGLSVPRTFTFDGSNDAVVWTTLDTQTGITQAAWNSEPTKEFEIASPQSFLYYRIYVTAIGTEGVPWPGAEVRVVQMQMDAEGETPGYEYDYEYGYSCYGEGCLDEPPVAQRPDPNPLIDLEAGFVPPQIYTSTKTVCEECPDESVAADFTNLVPDMTSHTAPSGVASASEETAGGEAWRAFDKNFGISDFAGWATSSTTPHWLQYQFAAATVVGGYSIAVVLDASAPRDWIFQGSNNGTTWTDLDEHADITWFPYERKVFTFTNTTAYLYYRLSISANGGGSGADVLIQELEMFGEQPPANEPSCATATATSEISQADADAQATATAQAEAIDALSCAQRFTSTQCYTATCESYEFGPSVTRCATRSSFVSQAEADAAALAAATELAVAALSCGMSNNTQRIEILDGPGNPGEYGERASPYPSVLFVSGEVGLISKVTVNLYGMQHTQHDEISMYLRSPTGTVVQLMLNCMDAPGGTDERDYIFDDDAADPMPEFSVPVGPGPHTYIPAAYAVQPTSLPSPGPLPNPGPNYETSLGAFVGEDPNGSWSLWIVDIVGLDTGHIANGWDLTLTLV